MRRILLLIVIAGIAFLLILFVSKPELIGDIWIWLIGLGGLILTGFQRIVEYFKNLFSAEEKSEATVNTAVEAKPLDPFTGTSLKLLRISDDGETTIGLLFVNDRFYCYTLEDTRREVKIPGQTRISAGTYSLNFRKELTELTKKYRERYPDWFSYHLQLENVKDFSSVYIHNGGDHTNTEGCILVSDSIQVQDKNTMLINSRNTYKRLYEFISLQVSNGLAHRIIIQDENWINDLKTSS